MREVDKKTLCYTCLGCNMLEDERFMGKYKCENYINGYKENQTNDHQTSLQVSN